MHRGGPDVAGLARHQIGLHRDGGEGRKIVALELFEVDQTSAARI
jgi:hypothetical protein